MTTTNTKLITKLPTHWSDDLRGRVLYNLRKFAHLDALQLIYIANLAAFREGTLDKYAAARTLRDLCATLRKAGMITVTRRNHDTSIYTITTLGAKCLRDVYGLTIIPGRAGVKTEAEVVVIKGVKSVQDVVVINKHRHAANWAAVYLLATNSNFDHVWTEREIAIGCLTSDVVKGERKLPFRAMGQKQPDAIGEAAGQYGQAIQVTWVEVEFSHRKAANLRELATWLVNQAFPIGVDHQVPLNTTGSHELNRVRFVIANKDAATFPRRLREAVGAVLDANGEPAIKDLDAWASERLQFSTVPPYSANTHLHAGWPATEDYRI